MKWYDVMLAAVFVALACGGAAIGGIGYQLWRALEDVIREHRARRDATR